ncbi:MAG TPA: flagellar hook capping FlgD N-terminal domain-containing protein [Syntrophales bacterium]|nr:flagellar hook capping FlgD N-terminal domain-containing protein [Syntrophales bacterium]
MANVTNTTNNTPLASQLSSVTSKTTSLGKDDFLKMLVAQLKHQDPLNPMDGTEFAAQLAQFSSLEQLTNMNTQLTNLGLYQKTMISTEAVNLLGKEVTVGQGNQFQVDGENGNFSYSVAGDAAQVSISILDVSGREVDRIEAGPQSAGQQNVAWQKGNNSNGLYSYKVTAVDANGDAVKVTSMTTGKVTAVQYKDNAIYLTVNGQEVAFSNIVSVKNG